MNTIYIVRKNGKIITSGTLQQCVIFVLNVAERDVTVKELESRNIVIEPAPQGFVKP